jgi:hypothetical protein
MANFRYSHLFTTKVGNAALQAAAAKLNAAEIALAIADGEEKILFKNENGDVVSVATEEQINALLANKTDYQVDGTNGKALMFNETDGGGAKFEHNDGTWSFVGVNDGGENGLAGQIYALKKNAEDKMEGSRIDITKNAMYYTVTSNGAAARMVPANEIAVKGDITAATADLNAKIEAEKQRALSAETDLLDVIEGEVAERKAEAVASVDYDESGKTIDFYNANNEKIDSIDATAFIKDGMIDSVTLETESGTTYLVIVWNTDAGKETTRIDLGDLFDADNYYTKAEADEAIEEAVEAEELRATSAETALQDAIEAEETRATTAEEALQDAIEAEETRATSAETALQNAIEAEAEARDDADVKSMNVDANAGITLTLGDGSTIVATEAEEITLTAGEF